MTEPKKPETPREWALCRCRLSCKVGKEQLEARAKTAGIGMSDYALFNLLSAVESLAEAMELDKGES